MKIAVVGGGPAGSRSAELLSRLGARVILYECRRGWEKPCGGGVPERSIDFCPFLADSSLPQRAAVAARIYSPSGREARVPLREPLRIFSRADLNGHLLARAGEAGVSLHSSRVTSLRREGLRWILTDDSGRQEEADFVVGADGASGAVRQRVAKSLPPLAQSIGIGYFVEGLTSDEIVIKFFDSLDGYLWIFPRCDHLAVGICGPTGPGQREALLSQLHRFLVDLHGSQIMRRLRRYGARIPSLPASLTVRDACLGSGWALVGDAAGLVDPLTREGIHYALASAQFLSEGLADGRIEEYPSRWEAVFGGELEWAREHKSLFFSRRFVEAFTLLAESSAAIQGIVSELVAGRQSYRSLRRRLTLRAAGSAFSLVTRFLRPRGGMPTIPPRLEPASVLSSRAATQRARS
jgi:flavin-dependent dehydrogenase